MSKTWAQERAAHIQKELRRNYGAGFDKLSESQQNALVAEQVLYLVLGQFQEQFKPAQDMIRSVLTELHTSFKPE